MAATLLAIETATDVCSVALLQAGKVTVELTMTRPRAHAENLTPMIRDALAYSAITPGNLDAVAVSSGPGSYTGLRIGVSTAKGLALAADAALVAVPSLEALVASVAPQAAPGEAVCALFNARRREVYAAAWRVTTPDHTLTALRETAFLPLDALPEWLPRETETLWLVGQGVSTALPVLKNVDDCIVRPLSPSLFAPSAAWVARLAREKLTDGQTEDLARFEPYYLQSFVAKKPQSSIFEKLSF